MAVYPGLRPIEGAGEQRESHREHHLGVRIVARDAGDHLNPHAGSSHREIEHPLRNVRWNNGLFREPRLEDGGEDRLRKFLPRPGTSGIVGGVHTGTTRIGTLEHRPALARIRMRVPLPHEAPTQRSDFVCRAVDGEAADVLVQRAPVQHATSRFDLREIDL